MKPYGLSDKKSKVCECCSCGPNNKKVVAKRERRCAKQQVKENTGLLKNGYRIVADTSPPKFDEKMIDEIMKSGDDK